MYMKLHLSSYRIPQPSELFALTGKDPADIRVAIIPNAKDYYSDFVRKLKQRETMQLFAELGTVPEIIDLQNYKDNSGELLKKQLGEFGLLWIGGGNTFNLRHQMIRTGFDGIIHDLLNAGLVYAGESAGAVVIGQSLKGIELADNPDYAESVTFEGIGVVPYTVIPHTDNPEFTAANDATRQLFAGQPVLELKDSQAAIFDSDLTEYRIIERIVTE
jgi:dipeptidase E